ncbi:MAG: hypothetical protein E7195_05540 [Peptococcaceae bacterium]|nr:hypothetical protein [Peptococcaceae bacterium]
MTRKIPYKGIWRKPLTNKELKHIANIVLEENLAQWEKYTDDTLYPNPFDEEKLAQNLKFFIEDYKK